MSLSLLLLNSIKSGSKRFLGLVATSHDVLKGNGDITNLTKLSNNLSVASHNNGRNIATVGVWIEAGSAFETSENNGVASFFEHLLYTGTKKHNIAQLQTELAKIGARLNSFTLRDQTAYYAECFSSDVEKVIEIIADVMRNTKLDANSIEEQRNILLRKLDEQDLDYRATVFDNLYKTAFQGTTYSLSPLGTVKTLENITKEQIINYADDHYKPSRMVLTGVGGIDHQQLSELAEKYFGDLRNEYSQKIPIKSGVRFTGSEFLYRDDTYPLMYGAIAVEGVPIGHIDEIPLLIASTSVGQWDRSHATSLNAPSNLIQKICQNDELLHYESFSLNHNATGLFGFYFISKGFSNFDILEFVRTIQRHWKHLSFGVTEDEIDRAKNFLKTNLLQKLESNTNFANHISKEVLSTGKITPLHQLERKIHYNDASSVREAVSRHIYDRDLASAAIGRTEAWPNYLMLSYSQTWWRL